MEKKGTQTRNAGQIGRRCVSHIQQTEQSNVLFISTLLPVTFEAVSLISSSIILSLASKVLVTLLITSAIRDRSRLDEFTK